MKAANFGVLFCLAVAGCAARGPDGTQPRSPAQLAGLTAARLLQCAGKPRHRQAGEGREVWTYETGEEPGGGVYGDNGGLGGSPAPVARRYCVARIHMENGRVTRVEYSGFTGGLFTRGDQCERLFAGCAGGN